jgi:hypothetical protein
MPRFFWFPCTSAPVVALLSLTATFIHNNLIPCGHHHHSVKTLAV